MYIITFYGIVVISFKVDSFLHFDKIVWMDRIIVFIVRAFISKQCSARDIKAVHINSSHDSIMCSSSTFTPLQNYKTTFIREGNQ